MQYVAAIDQGSSRDWITVSYISISVPTDVHLRCVGSCMLQQHAEEAKLLRMQIMVILLNQMLPSAYSAFL